MILNGIDIDFDFTDGDDWEKYENGQKKIIAEVERLKSEVKNKPLSESIKEECKVLDEFIDSVFGEGLSAKIFNKPHSLGERTKIYGQIVEEANKQKEQYQSFIDEYSPDRAKRG